MNPKSLGLIAGTVISRIFSETIFRVTAHNFYVLRLIQNIINA